MGKRGQERVGLGKARIAACCCAAVAFLASLSGCMGKGGGAGAVQYARGSPEDFSVGILIPQGLARGSGSASNDVDQRTSSLMEPAMYVLSSDGTLRAGFGRIDPHVAMPAFVRRIQRAERERLFGVLRDAGVLEPASAGQPLGDAREVLVHAGLLGGSGSGAFAVGGVRGEAFTAGEEGMVGVWWSAGGRRRSFGMTPVPVQDRAIGEASPGGRAWEGIERAVAMLREWSWRDGNRFEPALVARPAVLGKDARTPSARTAEDSP